jgi:hypothetical protein
MNNEQQELLDLTYKDYVESYNKGNAAGIRLDDGTERVANIDEFIRRIRQDIPFAQKFGLKFEKRELSLEERFNIRYPGGKFSVFQENYPNTHKRNDPNGLLDAFDIPTKLITITYNDTKLESYE